MMMVAFLRTTLCSLNPKEAIYTYGNRNPQGMQKTRQRAIWAHEHGPKVGMKSILSKGKLWMACGHLRIDYDDTTIEY
jgi:hypothetical protein